MKSYMLVRYSRMSFFCSKAKNAVIPLLCSAVEVKFKLIYRISRMTKLEQERERGWFLINLSKGGKKYKNKIKEKRERERVALN